jgi:hypothetical protein
MVCHLALFQAAMMRETMPPHCLVLRLAAILKQGMPTPLPIHCLMLVMLVLAVILEQRMTMTPIHCLVVLLLVTILKQGMITPLPIHCPAST